MGRASGEESSASRVRWCPSNAVPKASLSDTVSSPRNPAYPLDVVDKLQDTTMTKVQAWMAKRAGKTNNCTLENAAIRREW